MQYRFKTGDEEVVLEEEDFVVLLIQLAIDLALISAHIINTEQRQSPNTANISIVFLESLWSAHSYCLLL